MLKSNPIEYQFKLDENGLIPAIAQDVRDGQVLMMAWMNREAFDKTLATGQAYFWSRSRQTLWRKGETSGNTMEVISIDLDCDSDVLLLKVKPAGPACHTGARSCFYTSIAGRSDAPPHTDQTDANLHPPFSLQSLFTTIKDRQDHPKAGSYTNQLFSRGEDEIVKKIGEEAVEIILAAKGQGDQRLIEEIADLTYHTLVLLASRGLNPGDVLAELNDRHRS
jgi:phosphoribosyl-ATP pyrophosphohydrolase/phosphoribosyl-AMP cyclohydrolase